MKAQAKRKFGRVCRGIINALNDNACQVVNLRCLVLGVEADSDAHSCPLQVRR